MIKNSYLNLKLPQGSIKRFSEINGLTLLVRGGKKGTTYMFQQRIGNRYIKLSAKTLKEARIEASNNLSNTTLLEPVEPTHITLSVALNDHIKYMERRHLRPATMVKYHKVLTKYVEPHKELILDSIKLKEVFDIFLKNLIDSNTFSLASYLQGRLVAIFNLARLNYPDNNIPDISNLGLLYDKPREEKHLPCLTTDRIKDILSIRACKRKTYILLVLSLHLLLRPKEMVCIKVSDIDFTNKILTVPKTKTMENFRVPLNDITIGLMRELDLTNTYLFSSNNDDHLNSETINVLLKRNGFKDKQTAHSLRAIGRTWFEENKVRYEVAETILSHKVGNTTYRAYVRTDYFEERREVMQKWSEYLDSVSYHSRD